MIMEDYISFNEESCKNSDDVTTEEIDTTEYDKGFECGKQRVLKYPGDFGLCKKTLTAWKPSDRELSAMLTAIADEKQKGSDVVKELRKIYQQIKKLREE